MKIVFFAAFLLCCLPGVISAGEETELKSENASDIRTATVTTAAPTVNTQATTLDLTVKQRLRKKLLNGYDKAVQPVKNHTHAVVVQFGVTAFVHLDVDEMKSTLDFYSWLGMSWTDEFMTWNPEEYDGIKYLHMESEELWKPDIMLYNSADFRNIEIEKTRAVVFSDGRVLWVPPSRVKAFCKFDLRYWPVDKHKCTLKFASWTSDGGSIDLELSRNVTEVEQMNYHSAHAEWKILKLVASRGSTTYECGSDKTLCAQHYPHIDIRLEIQRDSPAYRSLIVLPCLILMLTTGCAFLLPPNSGEKLIVTGLSLIGSFMFLLYFANSLPFHSSVPVLVALYSNTAGLTAIAILLNVMCLKMANEKKYNHPPKFLTRIFSGCVGKVLCLGNYAHQVSSTHQRLNVELSNIDNADDPLRHGEPPRGQETSLERERSRMLESDRNSIIMQDWLLVAAGIERFFFLTYALAFAVVTSIYI